MKEVRENTVTNRELRKFGLLLGAMTIGVIGLLLPLIWGKAWPLWPWLVGGILVIWAWIAPATLRPIHFGWMKIADVLGWINTRIILTLVYAVIFVPIGALMRILGKDPMRRHFEKKMDTYRTVVSPRQSNNLEKPF